MRLLLALVTSVAIVADINFVPLWAQDPQDLKDQGQVSFQRVLDLTLKNSLKIALAGEQIDSAARMLRTAKRRRLPRVGVQGWFSGDLADIAQWGGENFAGYLTLDWDFYQDAAIMQAVAQSWANLTSALLAGRKTISEEIFTATSLFYQALKAKRQVETVEEILRLDQVRLEIVRSEFAQGRRTQAELGDADAVAFESDLALTRARQDYRKVILTLKQLTRDESITSVADLPREITFALDFPLEDAIQAALRRQPNVLVAKANLELAQVGVKFAKLKRLPSVRFLTGTDYAFAPYARPEEFGFRAGVIVSYPIYDAGDRKSRIEDAKSALSRAQMQVEQAQYQARQEVTDDYAALSNQLALLQLTERKHQEVETRFSIAEEQYEEKKIDELEMARIRLQYLQSLQRLDELRLDVLLARAKLLKSIGLSSTDEIAAHSKKGEDEK